jgi:hypothetical protein
MKPVFQPDVSFAVIAAIALLNPVVIAVGAYLGARCDQAQKLPIAGFAAALGGMAVVWIAAYVRMPFFTDAARAAGGILVAQFVAGTAWATIAYLIARARARS